MIQPRTHTRDYWEHDFTLTDSDIDQIYNHFIEVEKPQSTADVVRAVLTYRIAVEQNALKKQVAGYKLYDPANSYAVDDKLVFPLMGFAKGTVSAVRAGNNPDVGEFQVFKLKLGQREREFSAELSTPHPANIGEGGLDSLVEKIPVHELCDRYAVLIEEKVQTALESRDEFISLGGRWFVKALLAEINIGHLHLAEAVLDMSGGGPLDTKDILVHLDLDASIDAETQIFSLNYALLNDNRFDEIAPKNQVKWFLRRMEPTAVRVTPARLQYEPVEYDRDLLTPALKQIEREIADEWSDLSVNDAVADKITFALTYHHRVLGTLPLNTTMRKLLPLGRSPRQMLTLRDAGTKQDIPAWIVVKGRYILGLKEWYQANKILVGAYLTIAKSDDPNVFLIDFERRRPQREDVRLATVGEGRMRFEFQRRSVACGYDDLMVAGTDYTAALDTIFERAKSRSLASLIAALLPELAMLSPQKAVHAKTLYSVMNMVRRVVPGTLFAELVSNPAFVPVGEHYWRFNPKKMQKS